MGGWVGYSSGGSGGSGSGIVPSGYGDVKVIYDINENPIRYNFYAKTVLLGYLIIKYDINGNAVDYQGYDAGGTPL
jgi:hypothetical protein